MQHRRLIESVSLWSSPFFQKFRQNSERVRYHLHTVCACCFVKSDKDMNVTCMLQSYWNVVLCHWQVAMQLTVTVQWYSVVNCRRQQQPAHTHRASLPPSVCLAAGWLSRVKKVNLKLFWFYCFFARLCKHDISVSIDNWPDLMHIYPQNLCTKWA